MLSLRLKEVLDFPPELNGGLFYLNAVAEFFPTHFMLDF